jgi:hypothetical protein
MKNIALCISGYFSNHDGDNLMQTNYIYDNIINKIQPDNNIDIFIHSFDINNKSNILTKYPTTKNHIIEPQIDFTNKLNEQNKEYITAYAACTDSNYYTHSKYWFTALSLLYSRKQSIMLAINYSQEKNIMYDYICWNRFDLGIRIKHPHLGYNPSNLIFDVNLDNKYIYSAFWNQLNAGYADHWFISNMRNMILLADMYDYVLEKAFKLNSEYILALDTWPDSNVSNEFSNEILIPNNHCKVNVKYPLLHSTNPHLLHKFYFMSNTLYKDSKFLDYTHS